MSIDDRIRLRSLEETRVKYITMSKAKNIADETIERGLYKIDAELAMLREKIRQHDEASSQGISDEASSQHTPKIIPKDNIAPQSDTVSIADTEQQDGAEIEITEEELAMILKWREAHKKKQTEGYLAFWPVLKLMLGLCAPALLGAVQRALLATLNESGGQGVQNKGENTRQSQKSQEASTEQFSSIESLYKGSSL